MSGQLGTNGQLGSHVRSGYSAVHKLMCDLIGRIQDSFFNHALGVQLVNLQYEAESTQGR